MSWSENITGYLSRKSFRGSLTGISKSTMLHTFISSWSIFVSILGHRLELIRILLLILKMPKFQKARKRAPLNQKRPSKKLQSKPNLLYPSQKMSQQLKVLLNNKYHQMQPKMTW